MKHALVALAMLYLWGGRTRAQTNPVSPIDTQSSEISTALIEPSTPRATAGSLPDAPIPVLPSRQDGPMPCPAGDGRPCALLGGRLYFRDHSHMTQHDRTWLDALTNPMILGGLTVNLATAVWDYRATRACIDSHRCTEGNPLMGNTRAQELPVGIGLTAAFYILAAKLKQRGHGNQAMAILSASAALHSYLALRAQYGQ